MRRQLDRTAGDLGAPGDRMIETHQHVAPGNVRMLERLRDRHHLGAGNAGGDEASLPFLGVVRLQRLGDRGIQRCLVLLAVGLVLESRVVRPFGMAEQIGRLGPELPGDAEHEPAAALGAERAIGHGAAAAAMGLGGVVGAGDRGRHAIGIHRQLRVEQSDVE